jgi:hypothetical protein
MSDIFELPEIIRCFLSRDKETGLWIGRSLDFGLVTSGKSDEIAWKNLKSVVRLHVEHCFSDDRDAVHKHRASEEEFRAFDESRDAAPFRSDKIELRMVAPRAPDSLSFWMQGVELGIAATANLQSVH